MYIYKWIEGEKNLNEFCLKRFYEEPRFVETIGHAGTSTIHRIEKFKESTGYYAVMYFVYMESNDEKGYYFKEIEEKKKMSYEEIRADKTSILK